MLNLIPRNKKRKRCRYERDHSLSLLHADYMENEGIHVIAYEDDASRKILSIGEFNNATTDNALEVLKIAEKEVMEVNGRSIHIGAHNFIQIRKTKMVKQILFIGIILNQKNNTYTIPKK